MLRIFSVALVVALLSACAVQPLSLSTKASAEMKKLDIVMLIPQSNLNIDVELSNAGASGVLGAIIVMAIDDVRRSKASQAQASLTKSVEDFNFRKKMAAQQTAEFLRTDVANRLSPLQVQIVDSESQRKIVYDNSKASAVLFSRIDYKWVSGSLVATSNNIIYPKISALRSFREKPNESNILDSGNAIYRKIHAFKRESVSEKNINVILSEAVTNLAWQLATDLQHEMGGKAPLVAALPLVGAEAVANKTDLIVLPLTSSKPVIDDVNAVPYLTERGREGYRNYLTKAAPKAFALAESGGWYSAWSTRPLNPNEPTDPAERAVLLCNKAYTTNCKLYAVDSTVVWPPLASNKDQLEKKKEAQIVVAAASKTTDVPRTATQAASFADLNDVNAIPFINDRGREVYKDWLTQPTPRAFVISSSGYWNGTWGVRPANPQEPVDPVERTMERCKARSQAPCRLYAVNGAVVYVKDAQPVRGLDLTPVDTKPVAK